MSKFLREDSDEEEDTSDYPATITLDKEVIEALITFASEADEQSLSAGLVDQIVTLEVPPRTIIRSCINDAEFRAENVYTETRTTIKRQSSMLHDPAAKGEIVAIKYLLAMLQCNSIFEYPTGGSNPVNAHKAEVTVEGEVTTIIDGYQKGEGAEVGNNEWVFEDADRVLINHQNVDGDTALHYAAKNGHLVVTKMLVKAGADPAVKNSAGRNAVEEAEQSGEEGAKEVVKWMKGKGGNEESGLSARMQEASLK